VGSETGKHVRAGGAGMLRWKVFTPTLAGLSFSSKHFPTPFLLAQAPPGESRPRVDGAEALAPTPPASRRVDGPPR